MARLASPAELPDAAGSRRLPRPLAYALAAFVIGLGLFASVTPSPLYPTYSLRWHLSPLTLTLVYATYAVAVLLALLLAGSVSDSVGRRPALLVALAALLASTAVFALAPSVGWLFVARGLQGLATGIAISSAGAAMLDLHPRGDGARVGLVNSVVSTAGISGGILTSALLVQAGWQPLLLPYVVLAALLAVAFAGVVALPETVPGPRRLRLTVRRPAVPLSVRGPFLVAALTVSASWALGGIFFSLGPQIAGRVFGSSEPIVTNLNVVALTAIAALAQLLLRAASPWTSAIGGSVALAGSAALLALAAATGSVGAYLAGSAVAGAGFGAASLGGLRTLAPAIPAPLRASVMSAYYVVAYAAISVPAVAAGLLVQPLGLQATFEAIAVLVAAVAASVAVKAWRMRPGARSAGARRLQPPARSRPDTGAVGSEQ